MIKMRKKGRAITDLDAIKKAEIEILDETVRVCEEHHLKYFLAYGTLLGAVRHKGFIPWDDDIDIHMPRKDYEKLLKIWNNSGRYRLVECKLDHTYIYPFAKVVDNDTIMQEYNVLEEYDMGLYVDIFPYDEVKESSKKNSKFIRKCELLEKLRMYSMFPYEKILNQDAKKNFGRKAIWKTLRKIGPAKISRWQDKVSRKYCGKNTDYMGCLCTRYSEREILPKHIFGDSIEIEFEGKRYKAPANYDYMLTKLYGDYMQLPPENERVLKHNFKVWEVEKKG